MHSVLDYRLKRLKRGSFAKLMLLSRRVGQLLHSSVPLAKLEYRGKTQNKNLMIFLPGIDDVAEDFERRGFINALQEQNIAIDAVAVDAHVGYYASREIHGRITDDIIVSARESGYEQIWLAGVSLGGFGAASYAARHASHVSGLLLLAPYLGGRELVREIASAGGVGNWEPSAIRDDDYQRALWAWFKRRSENDQAALPIYLGYGNRDMFERANTLLADALPRAKVFSIPGGHDWRTWKQLWHMFLEEWKSTLR